MSNIAPPNSTKYLQRLEESSESAQALTTKGTLFRCLSTFSMDDSGPFFMTLTDTSSAVDDIFKCRGTWTPPTPPIAPHSAERCAPQQLPQRGHSTGNTPWGRLAGFACCLPGAPLLPRSTRCYPQTSTLAGATARIPHPNILEAELRSRRSNRVRRRALTPSRWQPASCHHVLTLEISPR